MARSQLSWVCGPQPAVPSVPKASFVKFRRVRVWMISSATLSSVISFQVYCVISFQVYWSQWAYKGIVLFKIVIIKHISISIGIHLPFPYGPVWITLSLFIVTLVGQKQVEQIRCQIYEKIWYRYLCDAVGLMIKTHRVVKHFSAYWNVQSNRTTSVFFPPCVHSINHQLLYPNLSIVEMCSYSSHATVEFFQLSISTSFTAHSFFLVSLLNSLPFNWRFRK